MPINIARNTRMWVAVGTATGATPAYNSTNTHEIEIQQDYSFSQNYNSTDISVEEGGPTPARGSASFNDSRSPADWSFSTYIRPYVDDAGTAGNDADDIILTPDVLLWNALATAAPYDITTAAGVSATAIEMRVDFEANNTHVLGLFDLIFNVDNVWYRITDCQVGSVGLNVDISDVGMTSWTGQGKALVPLAAAPFIIANVRAYSAAMLAAPYIENRLTTMLVTNNTTNKVYTIPVTGITLDINNNVTYITPNTLARLDTPVASYTGTFDVSGTIDAYLREDNNGTSVLLADMITEAAVTNSYSIAICMGGYYTTASPGVVVVMPTTQLVPPSISTGDVLTSSIGFKGVPTTLEVCNGMFIGMSPEYTQTQIDALRVS